MGIWLRESGVATADADAAAAGWGGDRLAVIEGPDGAWAVAMQTVWDTEADAAAFETAATTGTREGAGRRAGPARAPVGKTRWVLIALDAATASKVAGALGLAG